MRVIELPVGRPRSLFLSLFRVVSSFFFFATLTPVVRIANCSLATMARSGPSASLFSSCRAFFFSFSGSVTMKVRERLRPRWRRRKDKSYINVGGRWCVTVDLDLQISRRDCSPTPSISFVGLIDGFGGILRMRARSPSSCEIPSISGLSLSPGV